MKTGAFQTGIYPNYLAEAGVSDEQACEKVNKAFLGTKITKGNHNIKITYKSPWLNYGIIISGVGVFAFVGVITFELIKKKKISKK